MSVSGARNLETNLLDRDLLMTRCVLIFSYYLALPRQSYSTPGYNMVYYTIFNVNMNYLESRRFSLIIQSIQTNSIDQRFETKKKSYCKRLPGIM